MDMKFACKKQSSCKRCGACCHIRDKAILSSKEDKELRKKIYEKIGILYQYPLKRYTISLSHEEKELLEKAAKIKGIEIKILPKKIRVIEGKYVVMDWFLDHDVCPFYSEIDKKCTIYKQRPAVCKAFPNQFLFELEKEKNDVFREPFDDVLSACKKSFTPKHMT
jgi:Fe-S-cluster containining protein